MIVTVNWNEGTTSNAADYTYLSTEELTTNDDEITISYTAGR